MSIVASNIRGFTEYCDADCLPVSIGPTEGTPTPANRIDSPRISSRTLSAESRVWVAKQRDRTSQRLPIGRFDQSVEFDSGVVRRTAQCRIRVRVKPKPLSFEQPTPDGCPILLASIFRESGVVA